MTYRQALIEKKAEILARRRGEAIEVERHADPVDDVWALCAREVAAGAIDADTALLHAVEAALERADAGEYGVCEDCGERIGATSPA